MTGKGEAERKHRHSRCLWLRPCPSPVASHSWLRRLVHSEPSVHPRRSESTSGRSRQTMRFSSYSPIAWAITCHTWIWGSCSETCASPLFPDRFQRRLAGTEVNHVGRTQPPGLSWLGPHLVHSGLREKVSPSLRWRQLQLLSDGFTPSGTPGLVK